MYHFDQIRSSADQKIKDRAEKALVKLRAGILPHERRSMSTPVESSSSLPRNTTTTATGNKSSSKKGTRGASASVGMVAARAAAAAAAKAARAAIAVPAAATAVAAAEAAAASSYLSPTPSSSASFQWAPLPLPSAFSGTVHQLRRLQQQQHQASMTRTVPSNDIGSERGGGNGHIHNVGDLSQGGKVNGGVVPGNGDEDEEEDGEEEDSDDDGGGGGGSKEPAIPPGAKFRIKQVDVSSSSPWLLS